MNGTPARQRSQEGSASARPLEERIKDALLKKAADLATVLPRHLTPERMAQVASAMVFRTPELQECSTLSIAASVFQAAELGLDLSPSMGEAYLVPRWNKNIGAKECTFLPGYKGLVKLARQSGEVASIQARVVREDEHFRLAYSPDLDMEHVPVIGSHEPIRLVYAIAKLSNGERLLEALSYDEVEAVRRRSKSQTGPWSTDWVEMAKKTAIRRLCKILPRSLELARAIEADESEYRDDAVASVERTGTRSSRLADRLGAPALPPPAPEREPAATESSESEAETKEEEGEEEPPSPREHGSRSASWESVVERSLSAWNRIEDDGGNQRERTSRAFRIANDLVTQGIAAGLVDKHLVSRTVSEGVSVRDSSKSIDCCRWLLAEHREFTLKTIEVHLNRVARESLGPGSEE